MGHGCAFIPATNNLISNTRCLTIRSQKASRERNVLMVDCRLQQQIYCHKLILNWPLQCTCWWKVWILFCNVSGLKRNLCSLESHHSFCFLLSTGWWVHSTNPVSATLAAGVAQGNLFPDVVMNQCPAPDQVIWYLWAVGEYQSNFLKKCSFWCGKNARIGICTVLLCLPQEANFTL